MARRHTSGVLAPNGKIYFYGGRDYRTDIKRNDFYSFDPTTNDFTNLTTPGLMYSRSHVSVALPNGLIVYIGGYYHAASRGSNAMPYNRVLLYDTNTHTWEYKETTGDKFSERILASGTLGPDKKTIFMFGGFIGFISNDTMLVGFGQAITTYLNDINVLRMDSKIPDQATWLGGPEEFLSDNLTEETTGTNLSKGAIAGIVIGSIAFAVLLGLCIWKRDKVSYLAHYFYHRIIWVPRSGEPIWTEACRFAFRSVVLVLLLFFFGYTIKEIVNSDKSVITIRTESAMVHTPDIRFCFDGWKNDTDTGANLRPRVICSTDEGYDCSKFVTNLNMSIHQPAFSDRLGDVYCSLYSPPSWFSLTDSRGKGGNGTVVLFSFYGNTATDGVIHTTFYPPGKDPNVDKYNVDTSDIASLVTEEELETWIVLDLEDRYASNVHTISPKSVSTLGYQIKDHQYVTDNTWNRVGFLPIYQHVPEIETVFRSGVKSDNILSRGSYHICNFKIFPDDYAIIILQEKKVSTLLNVLGSVGGVISLAVAIQVWLFGFRPNSPWGIVHRWSAGPMKSSVQRNLQGHFNSLYTPVPFVNPVRQLLTELSPVNEHSIDEKNVAESQHIDYKVGTYHQQRMAQMEERVELMEQILKAYYVDDEVFQVLDTIIKQKRAMNHQLGLPLEEAQQNTVGLRQRLLSRTIS
ncbi:hypothetical protein CLU79DRAFT_854263 [Phycomyces nitens]|nr:hypothetical protein CLU79DRAFT_854263 [Phycomyces nitens]